jgi:hypothetical protein
MTTRNSSGSTPCQLRSNQTALLIIHGIGEQNPYETLDSFGRGIFSFLGEKCRMDVKLQPKEIAHKDWTQVYMRIGVGPFAGEKPTGYVDVYEYYWAPFTEDKVNAIDTLKWLIRTDLTPLRYLGDNLQEMVNPHSPRTLAQAVWLFLREIGRIVLLYLPLAASLVYLLSWLPRGPKFKDALRPLTFLLQGDPWWARPAVLACYALGVLMVLFFLNTFGQFAKRKGHSIEKRAEWLWCVLAIVFAVFFFWVGCELAEWEGVSFAAAWPVVRRNHLPLVAAIVAAALTYVLTKYVADVAVYTTADAKSKNYATRSAILDGSTKALAEILVNPDYDRVILAGHSLGSVIAYDTINELIGRVSGVPGPGPDHPEPVVTEPQLRKLLGLVTFGSPLDKIYYFFREHVREDQAIRAQILSLLHSFRKVPSGRDYGQYEFKYKPLKLEELLWLNAWSPLDPVSARLHFYDVKQQKRFWYWVPGLAHLGYWRDPDFYEFWCRALVVR